MLLKFKLKRLTADYMTELHSDLIDLVWHILTYIKREVSVLELWHDVMWKIWSITAASLVCSTESEKK